MLPLSGKNIVVGVSGGIAAYKIPDLIRGLRAHGAEVKVVMTQGAKAFVTPLTFQAVSGHPVYADLLATEAEAGMEHIDLARWADLIVIAPASANCLSKIAHGQAGDLLSTLCLATPAAIAVAPAMNQQMWNNGFTQSNLALLKQHHIKILGPACGEQACGDFGYGRMLEPQDILNEINLLFANQPTKLQGKTVLITAGPTQEGLDPVRYLTNHSSGKMAYALAEAAKMAGAHVVLVSGPTVLPPPKGVECVHVQTALQMHKAVMQRLKNCDIFIGCAAVADYRPLEVASEKIKKNNQEVQLTLIRNPDILQDVAQHRDRPALVIGFAAETHDVLNHAKQKLQQKKCDMIIANQVGEGLVFNKEHTQVAVIYADGRVVEIPRCSKKDLARQLIELM